MKSFFRKISAFFVLLYVAGIAFAGYVLMNLPQRLSQSKLLDLVEVKNVMPVMQESFLLVGGVLFVGLLAIIFLMISKSGQATESVKIARIQGQHNSAQEEQESEENDFSSLQLAAAEEALSSSENVKTTLNGVLSAVCNELEASQGAVYLTKLDEGKRFIELAASYAYSVPDSQTVRFEFGEGLAGQVAKEGQQVNISSIPEGYIKILSGLGSATPSHLIIVPLMHEGQVYGVAEIASFKAFEKKEEVSLQRVFDKLALFLEGKGAKVGETQESLAD